MLGVCQVVAGKIFWILGCGFWIEPPSRQGRQGGWGIEAISHQPSAISFQRRGIGRGAGFGFGFF
jgi:hypothetical protein